MKPIIFRVWSILIFMHNDQIIPSELWHNVHENMEETLDEGEYIKVISKAAK